VKSAFRNSHSAFSFVRLTAGSIGVDRSATRRVAPAGTDVRTILYDARYGQVAARKIEHFTLSLLIVLSVKFGERYPKSVVMIAGLLAIRTARFCVHYYRHCSKLHLLDKII
jgi:hypothetical protein